MSACWLSAASSPTSSALRWADPRVGYREVAAPAWVRATVAANSSLGHICAVAVTPLCRERVGSRVRRRSAARRVDARTVSAPRACAQHSPLALRKTCDQHTASLGGRRSEDLQRAGSATATRPTAVAEWIRPGQLPCPRNSGPPTPGSARRSGTRKAGPPPRREALTAVVCFGPVRPFPQDGTSQPLRLSPDAPHPTRPRTERRASGVGILGADILPERSGRRQLPLPRALLGAPARSPRPPPKPRGLALGLGRPLSGQRAPRFTYSAVDPVHESFGLVALCALRHVIFLESMRRFALSKLLVLNRTLMSGRYPPMITTGGKAQGHLG